MPYPQDRFSDFTNCQIWQLPLIYSHNWIFMQRYFPLCIVYGAMHCFLFQPGSCQFLADTVLSLIRQVGIQSIINMRNNYHISQQQTMNRHQQISHNEYHQCEYQEIVNNFSVMKVQYRQTHIPVHSKQPTPYW